MIKLREQLGKLIGAIHPRASFEGSTYDMDYPYIVYNLPNSFANGRQEIFNLDVDVWSYGADTTELETITRQVEKGLDMYKYIDENIQFSIYKRNRLNVEDDDKQIKRRKLIFELRYYDRRV